MPLSDTDNNLQFTNDEVKEILGSPPKWIIRWGNMLLLFFIGLLLILSVLVKHYDIVNGSVTITPIKKIEEIAVSPGTVIDSVLVRDGAIIKIGEPILVLRNKGVKTKLYAPEAGDIFFERLLQNNLVIQSDSVLMHINPANQTYLVSMIIPQQNWNAVKPGQQVMININNFSQQAFGSLTATVITKPQPTHTATAIISIQLENNNLTTHNKKIDLSTTFSAKGEIITGEKRLINVLFEF